MRQLIIISLLCFTIPDAFGQKKIDKQHFIELLNSGNYDGAFNQAEKIRGTPYGKNAVIDYIIAKSLCMKGHNTNGIIWLNHILRSYNLDSEQTDFINNEIRSCSPSLNSTDPLLRTFNVANFAPLPESSVSGKEGFSFSCKGLDSSNYNSKIGQDELQSRLFNINNKNDALIKIRKLLTPNYKIDTSGRFIIVSYKSSNYLYDDIQRISAKLEMAYNFFLRAYGLQPSDNLFTVYLVPSSAKLEETAKLVHGIDLPFNNIGYSCLSDLSLLGIASSASIGTLYHELFHLTIRTDVGDIPPWLDEGIASLYSVYKIENNYIYGDIHTWRILDFRLKILKHLPIPTLEKLLSLNWKDFQGGVNRNTCIISINYDISNMFLLYLQEKKLVEKMVNAFKDRLVLDNNITDDGINNIKVIEQVTGNNINQLSSNFYAWVNQKYGFDFSKLTTRKN